MWRKGLEHENVMKMDRGDGCDSMLLPCIFKID